MYELEEEIIHFVFKAFDGLKRKKEAIDLSFHSIMVGNMLKNIGCDDEIIYIGYLHDIIEDTKYTYDDLLNKYGKKIADSVLNLTENKSITDYVERKKVFLNQLEKVSNNLLVVEIADKLQNLISDYEQYKINGKEFLVTEANNYDEIKWYYIELKKLFNSRIDNNKLLDRYNEIVYIYFES